MWFNRRNGKRNKSLIIIFFFFWNIMMFKVTTKSNWMSNINCAVMREMFRQTMQENSIYLQLRFTYLLSFSARNFFFVAISYLQIRFEKRTHLSWSQVWHLNNQLWICINNLRLGARCAWDWLFIHKYHKFDFFSHIRCHLHSMWQNYQDKT